MVEWMIRNDELHSLKLTWHLKIGRPPKGHNRIPTIHFQVLLLLVSGRVKKNNNTFSKFFTTRVCLVSLKSYSNFHKTGQFSSSNNRSFTPPKFNIAPENGWLEDYFPFGMAYFQGLC